MANFSLTSQADAFKERFQGPSIAQYNAANVVWARIKKSYNFKGKKDYRSAELSNGGGFSTGSLATVSQNSMDQAELTAAKVYSVVEIDGEAIQAGLDSEGIFDVSALKHVARRGVKTCNRNMQRILFGDGTGKLYTGNASNSVVTGAGTSGDPYVVNVDGDATSIVWANLEEGDLVRVNAETTNLEITAINETSGSESISLVGTSTRLAALAACCGSAFTTTDSLYQQASKDNDPEGLGVLEETSGSTYGIAHTNRRWRGHDLAQSGKAISEDILNELILTVEEKSGETPDLIVASYYQFRKIKDFLGDKVQIQLDPRDKDLKGLVSFSALGFASASGMIPIVADRFVKKDYVYALNTDKIEAIHRPNWGWMDSDGQLFLRRDTDDAYQARYGGYMQIYIQPHFHGVLTGLADS